MTASRFDYFDDPGAPAPNSMVPSVNVVVTDDAGRILLIRRTDNGNWAPPSGAIDLGESMIDAAVRETLEESGTECEVTGLVGGSRCLASASSRWTGRCACASPATSATSPLAASNISASTEPERRAAWSASGGEFHRAVMMTPDTVGRIGCGVFAFRSP